jgi:hypothetical protein
MTGFDIYDRYDFILSWVMAILAVGSVILGAPLWVFALIVVSCCTIGFIRHFDEVMYGESRDDAGALDPDAPDTPAGAVSGAGCKPMKRLAVAHPKKRSG